MGVAGANRGNRGTKQRKFNQVQLPGMDRGKKIGAGFKKGSAFKKSNASTKLGRTSDPTKESVKSGGQQRSKNTLKRLELYRQKAPNKRQLHAQQLKPQRVEPDRRWFGNTRTINQTQMSNFREELAKEVNDPYRVVLKSSKLPMSLLQDSTKIERMNLLTVESFEDTFGTKKQRRKPKLEKYDLESMMSTVDEAHKEYTENQSGDTNKHDKQIKIDVNTGFEKFTNYEGHDIEEIFLKGTSKRIWRELYKVVDSSDVIIQVLDARDPMGTRCLKLERDLKKNHPHKHMILILNKCDLIPNWATRRWCEILRKEKPTLAFHASVTNPFGKAALIQLLRQFAQLMKDKKHMQVGLIGYPNVGKSSVINTLKKKEVCKSAPIPGQTKVWQYIALTKKIYAIDCPGIVPITRADFAEDSAKVLKGVVRAEKLEAPSAYIDEVLNRVKHKYLINKYNLPTETTFSDGEEFLGILARKMGKLLRGGEPDVETAARIVLFDWQRGRIPFFVPPPGAEVDDDMELETVEFEGEGDAAAAGAEGAAAEEGAEKVQRVKASDILAGKSAEEAAVAVAEEKKAKAEEKAAGDADVAEDEEKSEIELPDTSNMQDYGVLKCSMGFDDTDLQGEENSPAKKGQKKKNANKLKGQKLSGSEYKSARRAQRHEKDLAMRSDDSDVEDFADSDDDEEAEAAPAPKKGAMKKKGKKGKKTAPVQKENEKTAEKPAGKKGKKNAGKTQDSGLGAPKKAEEKKSMDWNDLSEFA